MSRRLIVTADDYGMYATVNQAIEECLAVGMVKATCVMMNMSACSQAASLHARFPHSSLGIHWTLTEGPPVLPPARLPSLVGADGHFHSASQLRRRWLRRQVNVPEVQAELQAQYQRFCEVVGQPDFWNTHQNFHVWPRLFEVCVALGQELHIPAMRCHRRFTVPRTSTPAVYHLQHPLPWVKSQMISWWASRAQRQGMRMPDGIAHTPGYERDQASLLEVMHRLPWQSVAQAIELHIHPSTTNQGGLFYDQGDRRVQEYRVFTDPNLAQRLGQAGVELVGFEVLHKSQEHARADV